jgi:hypothetical protein
MDQQGGGQGGNLGFFGFVIVDASGHGISALAYNAVELLDANGNVIPPDPSLPATTDIVNYGPTIYNMMIPPSFGGNSTPPPLVSVPSGPCSNAMFSAESDARTGLQGSPDGLSGGWSGGQAFQYYYIQAVPPNSSNAIATYTPSDQGWQGTGSAGLSNTTYNIGGNC